MSYLAFKFDENTRQKLLSSILPAYPKVVADHITIQLKRPEGALPEAQNVEIVGIADDENGLQALVVSVDGQRIRPDEKPYHITWSLDPEKNAPADFDPNPKPEKRRSKPYKPVHSNALVAQYNNNGKIQYFDTPISLGNVHSTFIEDAVSIASSISTPSSNAQPVI